MSDTTRNDSNTDGEHGDTSSHAHREQETLDYSAHAIETDGAHSANTDAGVTAVEAERPAAVPYEDPSFDPPVTHDPPAVSLSEPVAAHAAERDYYAPTAAVATAPATGAATTTTTEHVAPQPRTEYAPSPTQTMAPTPIYVQAPTPPKNRGNRGAGILIALLATAVYAALFAVVVSIISGITSATLAEATETFSQFVVRPVFYVPVIVFFLAFALLIAIVNRAGWWAYVLGGFLVAVAVYFSYIGAALLTVQAWTLTAADAGRFVATQWLNPGAIAAAVIAREVPIWFGSWIARNGRKVAARNAEARAEYDRQIAEGPQLARP